MQKSEAQRVKENYSNLSNDELLKAFEGASFVAISTIIKCGPENAIPHIECRDAIKELILSRMR